MHPVTVLADLQMTLDPVLIAEPDDGHAAAIREIVRILRPKIEPVHVRTGMAALEQLKVWRDSGTQPCVAIVGEGLSESGGLAALNYLAKDPVLKDVPVVTFQPPATDTPNSDASDNWTLDILPDDQDPYDVLVHELSLVLSSG